METPSAGRIVLFRQFPGSQPMPAIVVRSWPSSGEANRCNLQVFVDAANEAGSFTADECARGLAYRASVAERRPDETQGLPSWEWPPRVAPPIVASEPT